MRVALGHVPGTLLVAHEDVADRGVEQRVVGRQDAAAWEAEHDLDALHLEGLDECLRTGDLHLLLPFENCAGKPNGLPNWEAEMHAYVGVHLHEYYDNRDDFGTH